MIKFKTLRYRDYKRAQAIYNDDMALEPGQITDKDIDKIVVYAIDLVTAWDFTDPDSGDALPIDPAIIDDLTLEQFKELFREFNAKMGFNVQLAADMEQPQNEAEGVKKTNGEQ